MAIIDAEDSRRCKVCGEVKGAEKFRRFISRHGRQYRERTCLMCSRVQARLRMSHRRETEEGRAVARAAVARWKARNPDKVEEHRKSERGRRYRSLEERARRKEHAFVSAMDRIVAKNAGQAWQYWIATRAPDAWVLAYYRALGEPWRNPRLTDAERWRVRYKADAAFRTSEKLRLRERKIWRRNQTRISDDGTANANSVPARSTCIYCRRRLTDGNRTLDHMDPISRGGQHSAANLVECCNSCNATKSSKPFSEWLTDLNERDARRARNLYEKRRGAPASQMALVWAG